MKITIRLTEPVTQAQHQRYILSAAIRDVGDGLVFHGDGGALYFPSNPFKFNAEGTAIEGEIAASVSDNNITKFKQTIIDTMNAGLRGNTTKAYEPAADFPKVQVKTLEVENNVQPHR